MGVAVRIAGQADAPVLHAVAAATFALACPPGTGEDQIASFIATQLSEDRFREYLRDENRQLLLAVDDGGLAVGYTMLIFGEPADGDVGSAVSARPTVELSKVYLLPGQHGTGAASALMDATLDAARRRGVASVWLGVNKLNVRANRFYERSGFVTVGSKKFQLGAEVHDDFVRELVL
jgi:ribosomal protein S18 acetylase RimI-like enzyme